MSSSTGDKNAIPTLIPLKQHTGSPAIALGRPVMLIGSRKSAHIHLISSKVSRAHALLIVADGKLYIRDLSSRTHTYVNGQEIHESAIEDGDLIQIGSFVFRARIPAEWAAQGQARQVPAAQLDVGGQRIALTQRVILIGRRGSCDLALMEESASTAHAVIFDMGGKRFVRDLGSRTGTLVNGKKIHQEPLAFGDVIHIGETDFTFEAATATAISDEVDELEDLVGTAPLADLGSDDAITRGIHEEADALTTESPADGVDEIAPLDFEEPAPAPTPKPVKPDIEPPVSVESILSPETYDPSIPLDDPELPDTLDEIDAAGTAPPTAEPSPLDVFDDAPLQPSEEPAAIPAAETPAPVEIEPLDLDEPVADDELATATPDVAPEPADDLPADEISAPAAEADTEEDFAVIPVVSPRRAESFDDEIELPEEDKPAVEAESEAAAEEPATTDIPPEEEVDLAPLPFDEVVDAVEPTPESAQSLSSSDLENDVPAIAPRDTLELDLPDDLTDTALGRDLSSFAGATGEPVIDEPVKAEVPTPKPVDADVPEESIEIPLEPSPAVAAFEPEPETVEPVVDTPIAVEPADEAPLDVASEAPAEAPAIEPEPVAEAPATIVKATPVTAEKADDADDWLEDSDKTTAERRALLEPGALEAEIELQEDLPIDALVFEDPEVLEPKPVPPVPDIFDAAPPESVKAVQAPEETIEAVEAAIEQTPQDQPVDKSFDAFVDELTTDTTPAAATIEDSPPAIDVDEPLADTIEQPAPEAPEAVAEESIFPPHSSAHDAVTEPVAIDQPEEAEPHPDFSLPESIDALMEIGKNAYGEEDEAEAHLPPAPRQPGAEAIPPAAASDAAAPEGEDFGGVNQWGFLGGLPLPLQDAAPEAPKPKRPVRPLFADEEITERKVTEAAQDEQEDPDVLMRAVHGNRGKRIPPNRTAPSPVAPRVAPPVQQPIAPVEPPRVSAPEPEPAADLPPEPAPTIAETPAIPAEEPKPLDDTELGSLIFEDDEMAVDAKPAEENLSALDDTASGLDVVELPPAPVAPPTPVAEAPKAPPVAPSTSGKGKKKKKERSPSAKRDTPKPPPKTRARPQRGGFELEGDEPSSEANPFAGQAGDASGDSAIDAFSQLGAPRQDDPIFGNMHADHGHDTIGGDTVHDLEFDAQDDALSASQSAKPSPADRESRTESRPPLVQFPEAQRRRRKRKWFFSVPFLLLMMLVCLGATAAGVYTWVPETGDIEGTLRFANLSNGTRTSDAIQRFTEKQADLLRDTSAQDGSTRTTAISMLPGGLRPGFLESAETYKAVMAEAAGNLWSSPDPNVMTIKIASADPAGDQQRMLAVLQSLYQRNARLGEDLENRSVALEGLAREYADVTRQLDEKHALLKLVESTAAAIPNSAQLAKLKTELAELDQKSRQVSSELSATQIKLDQLATGDTTGAENASAELTGTQTIDDSALLEMNQQMTALQEQIDQRRAASEAQAVAARQSLDDSISLVQKQIEDVQNQMQDVPGIKEYLAVARLIQNELPLWTDELIHSQQELHDTITGMKRNLDERMVARRSELWEKDTDLQQMIDLREFQTRQINAAKSAEEPSDPKAVAALEQSVTELALRIELRKDELGTDPLYDQAARDLAGIIANSERRLEENRKRMAVKMNDMQGRLAEAAPALEQLPAEQKALAGALQKRLEELNAARLAWTEALNDSSANGNAEAEQAAQEELATLASRINTRKAALMHERQMNLSEQQRIALNQERDQLTVQLTELKAADVQTTDARNAKFTQVVQAERDQEEALALVSRRETLQEEVTTLTARQQKLQREQVSLKAEIAAAIHPQEPTRASVQKAGTINKRPQFLLLAGGLVVLVFVTLILFSSLAPYEEPLPAIVPVHPHPEHNGHRHPQARHAPIQARARITV